MGIYYSHCPYITYLGYHWLIGYLANHNRGEPNTPINIDEGYKMRVFEESWVQGLEQRYRSVSKYTTPFIFKLALDPVLSREKAKIEEWFQSLPDNVKPDILGRLRSISSNQHFSAYYELVFYQFFKSMGYSVAIHPKLTEGEPDLLVTGKNLDKPVIIEVATVFDDPYWKEEERKFNLILERLDKIEHYFLVLIAVESEHIPEKVNYKRLNRFVKAQLDSLYSKAPQSSHEIEYQEDGLELRLTAFPNLEKGPIVASYGLPARSIGAAQLRSMIIKKINKYKSVKKRGLSFVIALNITNMPAGEHGLLRELFGKTKITIKRSKSGESAGAEVGIDFSGLLTPKPGLGGRAQNTRLSTVLNVESRWLEREEENKPARRVHFFRVIHNPWASSPLDREVFKGYPQFVKISENLKGVSLDWVGEEAEEPFDC